MSPTIVLGYTGQRVAVTDLDRHATWSRLHPELRRRFLACTAASGYRLGVGTGWRSAASQDAERAERRRTGQGARMAPSSESWHCAEPAGAIDVVFDDGAAQRWAHDHAAEYGLWYPAGDEPWHVQALGYPYKRRPGQPVPALPRIVLPGEHRPPHTTPERIIDMYDVSVRKPGWPGEVWLRVGADSITHIVSGVEIDVDTVFGVPKGALSEAQVEQLLRGGRHTWQPSPFVGEYADAEMHALWEALRR